MPAAAQPSAGPATHDLHLPRTRVQSPRHPLVTALLLLAGAAAIVGGFWLVSSSGVITNRFKPRIESELSRVLNRTVTVGRLEGGVFDRVVLWDVHIAPPVTDPDSLDLTIARVVVRYSLWDILVRKVPLADGLREIQFIRPLIRFEKDDQGRWHGPNLLSWAASSPERPFQVPTLMLKLVGGEVRLNSPGEQASLHGVRGQLSLHDPTHARLFLSGRTGTDRSRNFRMSGEIDLPAGAVRLDLRADHVQLQPFERVARPSPYLEVLSGDANLEVHFASRTPTAADLIPGVEVNGKLVLNDVALKTPLLDQPLRGLYGVTLLQNDRLRIKNVQAVLGRTTWAGSGTIDHLQRPRVFVKVQDPDLRLEDLIAAVPTLADLKTSGSGAATILLKGEAPDLTATATVRLSRGRVGRVAIQNFEAITRFSGRELRLLQARGTVAQGSIEGQGSILFSAAAGGSPALAFHGKALGLDLGDLGSLFRLKALEGAVNGDIVLGGTLAAPTLSASLRSDRLQAAGMTFRDLAGTLALGSDAIDLKAQTNWGGMNGVRLQGGLRRVGQAWVLPRLGLYYGDREVVGIAGEFGTGPPEAISAQVRARRIPLHLLPFLPPALTPLNGTLDVDARLGGTRNAPLLVGRFRSDELHSLDRRSVDASGTVLWTGDLLVLSDLALDRSRCRAEGALRFGQDPVVQAEGALTAASLEVLTALAGGPKGAQAPRGEVSGSWALSGPLSLVQAHADLTFRDLTWNGVAARTGTLRFQTDPKRYQVRSLELRQPTGKLSASLDWGRGTTPGPIRLQAQADRFEVRGRPWSAALTLIGTNPAANFRADSQLSLNLDQFVVGGKAMPSLTGQAVYSWKDGSVHGLSLNWGDALTAVGEVRRQPHLQGRLRVQAKDSRLGAIRELLAPGRAPLERPVSGTVDLDLTPAGLNGDLSLSVGEGTLNGKVTWRRRTASQPGGTGADLKTRDLPLNTMFDLAMAAEPVRMPQGSASGTLRFDTGPEGLTQLYGDLTLANLHYGEWHFKSLNALFDKQGDILKLTRLTASQPTGSLQVQGEARLRTPEGAVGLQAEVTADQVQFIGRSFTGHFRTQGSLRLDPVQDLQLQVRCPDLKLNRWTCGEFAANIRYAESSVTIETPKDLPYRIAGDLLLPPDGSVVFRRLDIENENQRFVSATGKIDPEGGTTDLRVLVNGVAADTIARGLGWPQPWTGTCFGSVHYTDPDRNTALRIEVKVENGSVVALPFDTFQGTLVLDHDWLYFRGPREAAVLTRQGKYVMALQGKLPLPQTPKATEAMRGSELDLRLTMPEGDLSYLTFIPYLSAASGKSSLDLSVRGTMEYPSLNGTAAITDGSISLRLYTPLVEHLYANLRFNNNQVFIQRLDGHVGEGTLEVTAGPRAPWAAIFKQLMPDDLNLSLRSRNGRLWLDTTADYDFVSAWLTLNATLGGTLNAPEFGGTLELSDGQFTFPPRPLSAFTRGLKGSDLTYRSLRLVARNNLWFYNDFVRAQIKPDHSVVFDGGRNDFTGRGRVGVSKGTFTYLDQDFTLDPSEETALIFPAQEPPRLTALAKVEVRDVELKDQGDMRQVTIYLRASGTFGALRVSLSSDPELTQAQIMSLLTVGEDYSSWTTEELNEKRQSAFGRILGKYAGNLLGKEVEKRIKKFAPVDKLGIRFGGVEQLAGSIMAGSNTRTTASTSQSLLQNTQIDVGKYLTDDLYLNYRGTIKDRGVERGGLSWESLLGLEYDLGSSRRLRFYKNFDADSQGEFYWGIEARNEFEGWMPSEAEGNTRDAQGQKARP